MREPEPHHQEEPFFSAQNEDNGRKKDAGESELFPIRENRAHVAAAMKRYSAEAASRIGQSLQIPTREVKSGLLGLVSTRLIQDSRARKAIAGFIAGLALFYGVDQYRGGEEIAHAAASQEAAALEGLRQSDPELCALLIENGLASKEKEQGEVTALWQRLLEAEREKKFSFFIGEWKGLDLDTKARIMLRLVESDLDKEKNSYKHTPFILLDEYLSHPLTREILLKAASKNPRDAFQEFKEYRAQSWAIEILEQALRATTALEGRRSLKELTPDVISESERAHLEQIIAQEHPDPTIEELRQKFDADADEGKTNFFVNVWQGLSIKAKGDFAKNFLDWKYGARKVFFYFSDFASHPDARLILSQAAQKEPRYAIEYFTVYKDQPWAEQVLRQLLERQPYYAIEYFKVYGAFPWAESVLKSSLEEGLNEAPGLVVKRCRMYKRFSWGEALLRDATLRDADAALRHFAAYQEYPWADESFLLERAKHASYPAVRDFLQSEIGKNLSGEAQSRIEASVSELARVAASLLERNAEASFPRFREDPAIARVGEIDPSWIPDEHVTKADTFALAQYRILIARNLYFQGIETITQEIVEKESERIALMRERYRNMPLFKERNILVAAHAELTSERFRNVQDPWRFGKNALMEELKRQQSPGGESESDTFFLERKRPKEESRQEVLRIKRETLEIIRTLPGPLTVIFDGHGGPEGLYFSAGLPDAAGNVTENQEWRRISPQELADALAARYTSSLQFKEEDGERYEDLKNRVIIVLDDCYNSTYLRKMYDLLDKHRVPKPIVVGASEYGQLAASDFRSPYGSNFMETTILQTDAGGNATIGGVVDRDATQKDSNPSLYIPDEGNRPMQLSKEQGADEVSTLGV